MHMEIRLGNRVNVRVVGNPEIQLGFFFSSSAGVPMKPDISLLVWHFYSMLLCISSLENNNNNNRWAFILGMFGSGSKKALAAPGGLGYSGSE